MIDKIESKQIQDFLAQSSSKQPSSAETPDSTADASLQVNYASLIKKAMESPESDDNTVEQAKELLLSGELDSPESTRAAAEDIVEFGI